MNCKPGDLAVVIRGEFASGKIVRCLYLRPEHCVISKDGHLRYGPIWQVEPRIPDFSNRLVSHARDAILRPIRNPGDDASDESLAWLPPVPTKQREPA
jgi:hypothetical protein